MSNLTSKSKMAVVEVQMFHIIAIECTERKKCSIAEISQMNLSTNLQQQNIKSFPPPIQFCTFFLSIVFAHLNRNWQMSSYHRAIVRHRYLE